MYIHIYIYQRKTSCWFILKRENDDRGFRDAQMFQTYSWNRQSARVYLQTLRLDMEHASSLNPVNALPFGTHTLAGTGNMAIPRDRQPTFGTNYSHCDFWTKHGQQEIPLPLRSGYVIPSYSPSTTYLDCLPQTYRAIPSSRPIESYWETVWEPQPQLPVPWS